MAGRAKDTAFAIDDGNPVLSAGGAFDTASPQAPATGALIVNVSHWALSAAGAVLYEMLAGVRPFAGKDATEMIAAVVKATPD